MRSSAALPHGSGKSLRVAVFCLDPSEAEEALRAGADVVGAQDLVTRIRDGGSAALNFDRCIATPGAMPLLAGVARVLGPRGLMPNPKAGTVTHDVAAAVAETKRGRVEFRSDAGGVVHAGVGKASFGQAALEENVSALVRAVLAARPTGLKAGAGPGGYLESAAMSTTQGRGVRVSVGSLVEAAGKGPQEGDGAGAGAVGRKGAAAAGGPPGGRAGA